MQEKKSLTVKEWADEDKPREKLLLRGKKELTNAELIAILIRSGVPGKSAVDVAKEVLRLTEGSLVELSRLEHRNLSSIKGLGPAKASTLLAALELGWRMQGEISAGNEIILQDSGTLFSYMMPLLADLDHEEFWAVYLSNRRKVLGRQRISVGGQTDTSVDIRILMRGALECKAVQMAVLHNHPSGSLKPSNEDRLLTKRISEAAKILGIRLVEHMIIAIGANGRPDYYSFFENGNI